MKNNFLKLLVVAQLGKKNLMDLFSRDLKRTHSIAYL